MAVAVAKFSFGRSAPPIDIVITYGPSSPRCMASPTLRDHFYQQLEAAVDLIPKRAVITVMGDMNAKVGKQKVGDTYSCLESWSKGKRNNNGEALGLVLGLPSIANSLFKHDSRHITTQHGYTSTTQMEGLLSQFAIKLTTLLSPCTMSVQ